MALFSGTAPSSLLCQLARRKRDKRMYWKTKKRLLLPCRARSMDRARSLWTDNPFDLNDFKNGKNISIAEYFNLESKLSSRLKFDCKHSRDNFPYKLYADQRSDDIYEGSRFKTDWLDSIGDLVGIKSKQFRTDSLIHPFRDKTTLGLDMTPSIISSPANENHDDLCLLQTGLHLNILDFSKLNLDKLLNLILGDHLILELFAKGGSAHDNASPKLPIWVLSHPKLTNGLVTNPLDIQELVSNPGIWAPIIIPQSVASILSSLNEKEAVIDDLRKEKPRHDRSFRSASVTSVTSVTSILKPSSPSTLIRTDVDKSVISSPLPSSPRKTHAKISDSEKPKERSEEVKCDNILGGKTIEDLLPMNAYRELGSVRRSKPKEIIELIKAANPHLQRTVDWHKFTRDVVDAGKLRHPSLETKVAALLSRGACHNFVKEGNDCVGLFDETNFYSDQYHCQSADTGFAHWGGENELRIYDVESVDGFVLHFGFIDRGTLRVGDQVQLQIDDERRIAISANHTCAHLLNFGIDQIFDSVTPGNASRKSRIEPECFTVDFEVDKKMNEDEISKLENIVNLLIYHKVPVHREDISVEEAKLLNIPLSSPIDPSKSENEESSSFIDSLPDWSNESIDSKSDLSSTSPVDDNIVQGVTVVSIGIPASDILRNKDIISSCSLEPCGGTHVPDSSFIHSFVVTEVDKINDRMQRITAISQDQANLALRNAEMISAHIDALAEEVELTLGTMRADIAEKINIIQRNVSSFVLPWSARIIFQRRLDSLRTKFANFISSENGASASGSMPTCGVPLAYLSLEDDITRQLVNFVLEMEPGRSEPCHVQFLHFSHPKLVKNGLLFAARQVSRFRRHRKCPLPTFLLALSLGRIFCLTHVPMDDVDVDEGDVDTDMGSLSLLSVDLTGAEWLVDLTAAEWMKATFAAENVELIGGTINLELSEDRYFYGATKRVVDVRVDDQSDDKVTNIRRRIEARAKAIARVRATHS